MPATPSSQADSSPTTSDGPLSRSESAFFSILAIVPAVLVAILIVHYWVDSHLADEWNAAVLFDRFAHGTLRFEDLFRLQNEYRQFFPNLVFLAVGWVTKWDVRYLMVLSFVAACLVALNIYLLEKRTLKISRRQRLTTFFLSNLLIFSPVQSENWIQGQQLIYFFPIVCFTLCLVISTSVRLSLRAKFLLCAIAATVSTFSSANGMVCWLLVLPVLIFSANERERRERNWLTAAWLVTFGANLFLYLFRYSSPPGHPSLLTVFRKPTETAVYFLSLIGGPLAPSQSVALAVAIGLVLFGLWCWFGFDLWKSRSSYERTEVRARVLWLMLGAYSVVSAILITAARAGFGVSQSRSPRYTTFTLYLGVALIHLLAITVGRLQRDKVRSQRHPGFPIALRLLPIALVLLQVACSILSVRYFSNLRIRFLQAKACVPFVNVIPNECAARVLHNDFETLRNQANAVDALGFIRPRLVKTNRIDELRSGPLNEASGSFDGFAKVDEQTYVASGRAFLTRRKEPADAVLLVSERPGEPATVFAMAYLNSDRDYVSYLLGRGVYLDSRWTARLVDSTSLREATVSAWTYDVDTGQATKLPGAFVIPASPMSKDHQ